ncbi:MAG TPA: hypothetical protein VH420_01480 [Gaiellaceae bacterium]
MIGIVRSYRWRRRLLWLGAALVLLCGVVVAVLEVPNRSPKVQGPSNEPAPILKTPKPVRLTHHDEVVALRVGSEFISTAVARKDVDRSWNLVAPEFRSEVSRAQWDRGRLPVSPYSVRKTTWKFDYADSQGAGWTVTLYPAKGAHEPPQDFQIGLHPLGSGKRRHWVVDYWQAAPTSASALSSASSGSSSGSGTPASGKAKESEAWLLLPLALLSLIVLIPLGVAGVNYYRGNRARALMRP